MWRRPLTRLQPLNFVVDTLISQGLHILAGSPKVGKSWMALWLAVTVAKGEEVWEMPVRQGTTFYLCLEDSQLRIQNRLFEITEDRRPASTSVLTAVRWDRGWKNSWRISWRSIRILWSEAGMFF